MLHVFTINESINAQCAFRQGVPLPKGMFFAATSLELLSECGQVVSCSSKVLSLWPDKSVRWILLEGIAELKEQDANRYFLKQGSYRTPKIKTKWVHNNADHIQIDLKHTSLCLSKNTFLSIQGEHLLSSVLFNFNIDQKHVHLTNVESDHELVFDTTQRPLFCKIAQRASFLIDSVANSEDSEKKSINLHADYQIFYETGAIELQVTLHNPQAIVHHDGKWDLGNENSIYLKDCSLEFALEQVSSSNFVMKTPKSLAKVREHERAYKELSIIQHSSGGECWNSPNHKSYDNQVHLKQREPKLTVNGETSSPDTFRPEPALLLANKSESALIYPQHFWQKFPSQLHASPGHVKLQFVDCDSPLELQPGEKLSRDLTFVLQKLNDEEHITNNILLQSPSIALSPELIEQTKVIPWFTNKYQRDHLQSLINEGISGLNSFHAKREALDEYGWRNFGDIFADHEAAEHTDILPFVSHYNNQYDPLFGFLKQWLLSGERQWKVLADDLFDHLIHIDIYHTDLDKPEYNHGLFWHTDHYLQAETASHRTYSKYQPSDVYQDHAGGGGPGSHHCYTSGLVLYYWLSGNQKAYQCTLNMYNWMHNIYEGDNTLLGLILQLKNANYLRNPFNGNLLLGAGTGTVRNLLNHQYPLDRGTGNYVNTILDAYELTLDSQYLDKAEFVILNTIGAEDDFSQRNFDDIENTWFYVVFLQSVAKYLFYVGNLSHSIAATRAARQKVEAAFLHYVNYICEYENPYLTQKEKLEYPNDTWTAQDLRKVQLLAVGATIVDGAKKQEYIAKAKKLDKWINSKLSKSNERSYTRLLALMMQNYGAIQLIDAKPEGMIQQNSKRDKFSDSDGSEQAKNNITRVLRFLRNYSISRERRHLVRRIPKLQRWFGKP